MDTYAAIRDEWAALRPHGGFDFIMSDPPWRFATRSAKGINTKGAEGQYVCRSLDWIKGLPIDMLAGRNCMLWLWATNPMLPQALEVLRAWGFQYKTAGHWSKRTKHGKLAFGTGYILRCAGEPFLIGTRGEVKTARNVRSVIDAPAREHSRKPDEAFIEAERLMPPSLYPRCHRIEIFARQKRPGWDVWGDQIDNFPQITEGQ